MKEFAEVSGALSFAESLDDEGFTAERIARNWQIWVKFAEEMCKL